MLLLFFCGVNPKRFFGGMVETKTKNEMEMTLESLVGILGLLVGGSSGAFFTWKYQRKKAKAEAVTAEAEAEKAFVEVIQEMREMYKADREEQKAYIDELKDDRRHLREERDVLRKRQDELEETVRGLQREVAINRGMMDTIRPLICGRRDCKDRLPADIEGFTAPRKKKEAKS